MTSQETDLDRRFVLAKAIAQEAGAMALDYFNRRDSLVIETKHDPQDVVSIADRNVEKLLRERVAATFPDDGFLGEEFGHTAGASGYTWVVDPIDGTAPFVSGMPNWCVSVAVLHVPAPIGGTVVERPAVLGQVALCHAFMPNAGEAMNYTRTSSPRDALSRLGDLVPLVVITLGGDGAIAVDATTGDSASVPGLDLDVVDTTGAGDVFGASLVTATLAGWPLVERLRFANLAAALSVGQIGGAPAAPGWKGVARWWHSVQTGREHHELRRDYAFLDSVIPHNTLEG